MSKWDVKNIPAQDTIQPNLIPMVDIMFLLLLFLMLGADMGQRELEDMELSKAVLANDDQPKKGMEREDRLTVNIYHLPDRGMVWVKCDDYAQHKTCRNPNHWRIAVKGNDYKAPDEAAFKKLLAAEAEKGRKNHNDRNSVSERKIMLRADNTAPFGLVQGVMNSCAWAKMYKIECGVAKVSKEEVIANAQ